MSRVIPPDARELAAELDRRFAQDAQLAKRQADAEQRLTWANDQLWCGLHPDGLAAIYGEDHAAVAVAFAGSRSEALGSHDPLTAVQRVHWRIHRAFIDYQTATEGHRQLAAGTGELIRWFVDGLVAAGWSEQDARNANVHELASWERGITAMIDPHDDPRRGTTIGSGDCAAVLPQ